MASRKVGAKGHGPIRVTLPVSVASDLQKLERALANAAQVVEDRDRHSGWHGGFMQVREFVVDPASLEVTEAAYTQ
jgi:hypothetical protein